MNSSSAMPISDTPLHGFRVAEIAEHRRADQRAGDDVAEGRAEPEPAEHGDEDQGNAEHDRAALEQIAPCHERLARVITGGLDRREQGPERQQDRAVARLARARRRERLEAGPVAGSVLRRRPASGSARSSASVTSSCLRPIARAARAAPPTPGRTRRRGPAATALRRGRSSSSWTASVTAASAGRRAQLGPAVLAFERARLARATPPAAGFRSCRAARSFPPPSRAAGPVLQARYPRPSARRGCGRRPRSRGSCLRLGALGNPQASMRCLRRRGSICRAKSSAGSSSLESSSTPAASHCADASRR